MSHRPIHALLGAVTLAALAITTTGTPAGAAGDKAPPCPAEVNIIVSDAKSIDGTHCDDLVIPGPHTQSVETFGGNDVVRVTGTGVPCTHCPGERPFIYIDLGDGDDQAFIQRATTTFAGGGFGNDILRADWMVLTSFMTGVEGDDRLTTGSPAVTLWGSNGDDRLEVASNSPPDAVFDLPTQSVTGGAGNDLVITSGARGARTRTIQEGPGDDIYRLRQPASDTGRDVLTGVNGGEGGVDTALLDPRDDLTPDLFGRIESLSVAWGS